MASRSHRAFCPHCNRNVTPTKPFIRLRARSADDAGEPDDWLVFAYTMGVFYIFYYLWFRRPACPACGAQDLGPERPEG